MEVTLDGFFQLLWMFVRDAGYTSVLFLSTCTEAALNLSRRSSSSLFLPSPFLVKIQAEEYFSIPCVLQASVTCGPPTLS